MSKRKFSLLIILLAVIICVPLVVNAQGLKSAGKIFNQVGSKAGADTYTDVESVVGKGINAALSLVGLIFLILMIYAGYLWMTARGEEEQIKKAQKIIVSTLIGFVIVASAYAITVLITQRFEQGAGGAGGDGSGDGTGGGGAVCCRVCEKDGKEFEGGHDILQSEAACKAKCDGKNAFECFADVNTSVSVSENPGACLNLDKVIGQKCSVFNN